MAITGKTEGTRFAHDVTIFDPATQEEIGSLSEALNGGGFSPQPDISDVPTGESADAEANANAINGILGALRAAGLLE